MRIFSRAFALLLSRRATPADDCPFYLDGSMQFPPAGSLLESEPESVLGQPLCDVADAQVHQANDIRPFLVWKARYESFRRFRLGWAFKLICPNG